MATEDATTLGVELIPPDDDPIPPDVALAAASASALDEPVDVVDDQGPEPFGLSWLFDFERGRFVMRGDSPAETQGFDSLSQWCLMAIHSARFAHPIFSDEFGLERPDSLIGKLHADEMADDYAQRLKEALLVHDRVTDVEIEVDWNPADGIVTLTKLVVTTDEDEQAALSGVVLTPQVFA